MDHAARDTMELYPDIVLAFGESDEYRHVYGHLVRCSFLTHLICCQFSFEEVDNYLQSSTLQNCFNAYITIYLILRFPLVKILPWNPTSVPSFLRRTDYLLPHRKSSQGLFFLETGWQYFPCPHLRSSESLNILQHMSIISITLLSGLWCNRVEKPQQKPTPLSMYVQSSPHPF